MSQDISHQMYQNLFKQMLEMWVEPEMEKRRLSKGISSDFKLRRAQIIFTVAGPCQVRLNNEVKAIVKVKMKTPKSVKKGEEILEKDVDKVLDIKLLETDQDFGHITALQFKGRWVLSFSFLYDVSVAEKFYKIGKSFLVAAKSSWDLGKSRPTFANLYNAAHNLAKARIYFHPDKDIRKTKKHSVTWAKVNMYSRNNVFSESQKDAYNFLMNNRDSARYEFEFDISDEKMNALVAAVTEIEEEVGRILIRGKALSA